jgi:hypothetical protein
VQIDIAHALGVGQHFESIDPSIVRSDGGIVLHKDDAGWGQDGGGGGCGPGDLHFAQHGAACIARPAFGAFRKSEVKVIFNIRRIIRNVNPKLI